ncbi:MAG: hypothetical protein JST11_02780 [Acidobacteria bacterium]|nr:hypothetical protein [Acidobacteriota bacterium]
MGFWVRRGLLAALLLPVVEAQTLADPAEGRAMLARAPAATMDCQVSAIRPFLNLAQRLQSGYFFHLPPDAYEGPGHSATVLTAITAKGASQPVYLIDRLPLPPAQHGDARGDATGIYFLGSGSYHVDWLLVDDAGRSCRKQWFVDAEAGRGVKTAMAPGTVADVVTSLSGNNRAHPGAAMRVTVLLDAAPLTGYIEAYPPAGSSSVSPGGAGRGAGPSAPPRPIASSVPVTVTRITLRPGDQVLLLGALSALMERLPAAAVRLVVFNLDQQKELYRSDNFQTASLGDVARTLNRIQLAKVEYRVLRNRMGHIDLLAGLINRELSAEPVSDAVIFLGPRERFHDKFPEGLLRPRRGEAPRFYFLAYQLPVPLRGSANLGQMDGSFGGLDLGDDVTGIPRRAADMVVTSSPEGMPDTLSRAIARLKGKTIAVGTPRQFAKAVNEIARRGGK